jgi:hypothetical protein
VVTAEFWARAAAPLEQPDPDPDAEFVAELQRWAAKTPYAEALMKMAIWATEIGVGQGRKLTDPEEAVKWALGVAAGLRSDGWPDDPGNDEDRRRVTLEAWAGWQARSWDSWQYGDGHDKGPNPYLAVG